ncbi:MAG: PQQ-dependent sugar dehydrogenase [Phycisphaerales bacterium]|nr:PQQ-dependent sugar dehydrogenase [Phycisphaerales bacterium]
MYIRLVVSVLALIATQHAVAETAWEVTQGSTAIDFESQSLERVGLQLTTVGKKPVGERFVVLQADDATALQVESIGGLVSSTPGGTIRLNSDLVIRNEETGSQIALAGVSMLIEPANGITSITIMDDATSRPLFHVSPVRAVVDQVSSELILEGADLIMTADLASQLGAPTLSNRVVGSVEGRFSLAWAGGDDPAQPFAGGAPRGGNNGTDCNASTGQDVIIGDLYASVSNPASDQVNGVWIDTFSVGTESCNIGNATMTWESGCGTIHPLIAQNCFRLKNGKFEQIGQSWLKHGFAVAWSDECGCGCTFSPSNQMLPGCGDPYGATLNNSQGSIRPKFRVNPSDATYVCGTRPSLSGSPIERRLQVKHTDIDPALNAGARFFVEGQYLHEQDAAAGNDNNNASYREISVTQTGTNEYSFGLLGSTQREQAGIRAWQDIDPTVVETDVEVAGDGLYIIAAKATQISDSTWHYEYAVQNLNGDRGIRSFRVPVSSGAVVTNIGFHDVDYHSGDGINLVNRDGTDWTSTHNATAVTWSMVDVGDNSNALLWGTLYNFSFDTNVDPASGSVTFALWRTGTPTTTTGTTTVPGGVVNPLDCNNNGVDDEIDLANLTSSDCNNNGVLDECELPCELTSVRVATGLGTPVFATAAPGDSNRLFIVQQSGEIVILNLANTTVLPTPFLDISSLVSFGGERGLFAMAFHPDYANNRKFYVSYTNLSGSSILAQYLVSAGNPNVADAGSATILRTVSQPFANHNGGQIQFGRDGKLYWGLGDGGSANDPSERAQNDASPLGKMHRIDVDNPPTYQAADNPGAPFLPDVWAKGLRNPWRFSFDRLNGDLYIGDVGQDAREEIDYQPASSIGGENYGWDCREGDIATPPPADADVGCDPNAGGYVDPIRVEQNGAGFPSCSITGGYVYRGCAIPWLSGTYFYSDYCGDYIRTFRYDGTNVSEFMDRTAELQPLGGGTFSSIVSFGEDADGELYVISSGGSIYKIVCNDPNAAICGNGTIEPGEQCENPDGAGCDCECQTQPIVCESDIFADNFETDTGWTMSSSAGTTSGFWDRGIPVNDPAWAYDPIADFDGSGSCYLTQNAAGNTDVDDGSVTLTSPAIDTTGGNISVSYAYYLNLNAVDGGDSLRVEMSNNGDAGPWFIIDNHTTNGDLSWRFTEIRLGTLKAAGFTPSVNTKVRFTATDGPAASVVEAGIDAFRVCRVQTDDCNVNCIDDAEDIANLTSFDCNENGIPDECEENVTPCDCNANGVNDAIDLAMQTSADCNGNDIPDECDIASGFSIDCDGGPVGNVANGQARLVMFCSGCHNVDGTGGMGFPGPNIRNRSRVFIWNKLLPPTDHPGGTFPQYTQQDFADLEAFLSDSGGRGRPDLIPDSCQALQDCDGDNVTDGCELDAGTQADLDHNGIPDDCIDDCPNPADGDLDLNGVTDGRDIGVLIAGIQGSPSQDEICAGDFSNDNALSVEDIAGMVNALLAP